MAHLVEAATVGVRIATPRRQGQQDIQDITANPWGRMNTRKMACIAAILAVLLSAGGCRGDNLFSEPGSTGGEQQPGSIVGQVTAAGVPVGNVTIIVVNTDSTSTDSQGLYRVDGLPAATYSVTVRVPANYTLETTEPLSKSAVVGAAQISRVDWRLTRTGDPGG